MKVPSTPYWKLAVGVMASLCSFSSNAQVPPTAAGYLFTAYPGTYTSITGGTNIAIIGDDLNVQNMPIGFTFPFATGTYTTFTANSNGWVALGNKGPSAVQMRTNTAANAGVIGPMVMALWDDLNGSPSGQASYLTTGTAPNRVLTVQFNNWKWIWTGSSSNVISYQVKLYESGRIECHYQQGPDAINPTALATIGIARNATDYQTLQNGVANPTVSSTTFYDGVNSKPPNGQVYAWDAPLPNNTSVAAIPQPNVDICIGQHSVAAQVKNEGGNIINNVRVNWSVDGIVQPFVTYSTPIPIGGTSAAIPLGNTTFPASAFTHQIKVWTSHPNGLTDPKPENDSLQVSRKAMDPPSAFMFFEKTRICPGDSLLLWAPYDPIYTYVWQYEASPIPGATDSAIWVKNDGNYSVKVFNPACSSQSAFHKITVKPAQVELGKDSSKCETIPSQELDADEADASYIWSTGDTTKTIPV